MERRSQAQAFEIEDDNSSGEMTPMKRHSNSARRWTESGPETSYLASYFPELLTQCFGVPARNSLLELEQKSANYESRVVQLSETLKRERELRAGDLTAFDAQVDQLREEKESAIRELEDFRNVHKGTSQRLEEVEGRAEKLSEDVRRLESQNKSAEGQASNWKQKCSELEFSLSQAEEVRETIVMSHRAEKEELEERIFNSEEGGRLLRGDYENLKDNFNEKEAQLDNALQESAKHQEESTRAQQENVRLKENQKILKSELEARSQQLSDANEQINTLERDLQNRDAELQANGAEIEKLQEENAAHVAEIDKQKIRLEELNEDLQISRDKEEESHSNISILEKELQNQKNAYEQKHRQLEEQIEKQRKELEALSLQNSEFSKAEIGLKSELVDIQNGKHKAESKVQELERDFKNAESAKEKQLKEFESCRAKITVLEKSGQKSREDNNELSSAHAEEHEAKVQAQNKVKSLEKELSKSKATIVEQKQEIFDLGSQLENLEEELMQRINSNQTAETSNKGIEVPQQNGHQKTTAKVELLEPSVENPNLEKAPSIEGGRETDANSSQNGHMLSGVFKDREEWQTICSEGLSQGWLINPDEVVREQVIGKGSFGETYLGLYLGETVAVKCVRVSREIEAKIFLRELKALARVRHSNLMPFKGAVLDPPETCWLVVEYLSGGTLSDWLYGKENRGASRRSLQEKVNMGIGIAKGMLALEATDPPIMHRDLKPTNVLLDESGSPKISDFGLCREHLEDEAYNYTGETGSYTYMSPEMMRGEMYGPSTDVYSYAILLAEILRQRPPFEEFYLSPVQIAEGVAYQDIRPSLPREVPSGLKYLIEACWCPEPEGRPDFSTILGHLMDISKSLPTRRGFFS